MKATNRPTETASSGPIEIPTPARTGCNIPAPKKSTAVSGSGSAPALDKLEKDGKDLEKLAGNPAKNIIGDDKGMGGKNRQTVRMLGAGFIVTSLLWASALAAIIDKRFMAAAAYLGGCAVCSLTGIMHSPLPGSPLVNPFNLPGNLPHTAYGQTPIYMAASYAVMVALLIAWDKIKRDGATEEQVAHKQ